AGPPPAAPPEEARAGEPAASLEAATGRQEPALSIEWVGPTNARLGVPTDYTVVVRNTGATPAQQVLVRVRAPAGLSVVATDPRINADNGVFAWDVGTLHARQEKSLVVRLV